eukprot:1105138-Rhodomonas_salina.3
MANECSLKITLQHGSSRQHPWGATCCQATRNLDATCHRHLFKKQELNPCAAQIVHNEPPRSDSNALFASKQKDTPQGATRVYINTGNGHEQQREDNQAAPTCVHLPPPHASSAGAGPRPIPHGQPSAEKLFKDGGWSSISHRHISQSTGEYSD